MDFVVIASAARTVAAFVGELKPADWVIAAATFFGPISALRVQRRIDVWREKQARRTAIFRTLMATRMSNLSPDHLTAVNAIPLDFKDDAKVIQKWEEYFAHLCNGDGTNLEWQKKRSDLFISLLSSVAATQGYPLTPDQISKFYAPIGLSELEKDQLTIQRCLALLLKGETALNMNVVGFPGPSAEELLEQGSLRKAALSWLEGKTSLRINDHEI